MEEDAPPPKGERVPRMKELITPKFSLGRTVATPGALEALEASGQSPAEFLSRHVRGDWGEICEEDRRENEFALGRSLRVFSVYRTRNGTKLWVVTEADRSATTLLLPDEY